MKTADVSLQVQAFQSCNCTSTSSFRQSKLKKQCIRNWLRRTRAQDHWVHVNSHTLSNYNCICFITFHTSKKNTCRSLTSIKSLQREVRLEVVNDSKLFSICISMSAMVSLSLCCMAPRYSLAWLTAACAHFSYTNDILLRSYFENLAFLSVQLIRESYAGCGQRCDQNQ